MPWRRVQTLCLVVACAAFFIDAFLNMAQSPVLMLAGALAGIAAERSNQPGYVVRDQKG